MGALGRPALPPSQRASEVVAARFTPGERELIERAAKKSGRSLSEFLRDAVMIEVRHTGEEQGVI